MASQPQFDGVPLTAEEFGYLLGGRVRAAEVAIADLLERGVLRVNRDGELSTTGAATGLTRLETEVVAVVGSYTVAMASVVQTVSGSNSMRALADSLRDRGLVPKPKRFSLRPRPRQRGIAPGITRDRLETSSMLPAAMLLTAGGLVAADGCAGYPDGDTANALDSGRATYAGYSSCSSSTSTCSTWGGDGGSGGGCGGGSSCGGGGSSCSGGGSSCGGGGSSCGGGGGGGCGGGSS